MREREPRRWPVLLLVALACGCAAPSAQAYVYRTDAKLAAAKACPGKRVHAGGSLGTFKVRFRLLGHVSCSTAHRLARTYFPKVASGKCGQGNNFCVLKIHTWSCSLFFAAQQQEAGGANAGCFQPRSGAKVRFFYR